MIHHVNFNYSFLSKPVVFLNLKILSPNDKWYLAGNIELDSFDIIINANLNGEVSIDWLAIIN